VIVRVIQAAQLPVDDSLVNRGSTPYVWITTAPNTKKRGPRKVTQPPPKESRGFFQALKKAAGSVGLGENGSSGANILNEAFTELGSGADHVWDEEFTLMVDKVGDRLLRVEAVDDGLKPGKDSLGLTSISVESLPLGKIERNSAGLLHRSLGEQSLQWHELGKRQLNRDEEQLEMVISLVEARGLVAADKNGTSDPYCTLELDATQKRKSRTQKKTLDPKWGEAFKFALGTYDEVMGKTQEVNLKHAASTIMKRVSKVDIFSEIAHHGVAALGAVVDEEHHREQAAKQAIADATAPAILHLSVIKAKDLIAADSGGTSDPYVRIHVGKEIANGRKTRVVKKTLNPEWNEQFEINIRESQRKETVTIEVFDKDVIGKDDSLGKFTFQLESLNLKFAASGEPLSRWHSFDPTSGEENKGQVLLAYELVKRASGLQPKAAQKKEFRAITVRVWDYDMGGFGSDDFLGQVVLPLNMLAPDESCDRWFDLEARPESKGKDVVSGQVRLKVMSRFKKDTSRSDAEPQAGVPGRLCLMLQRLKILKEQWPTELALTIVGANNLHARLDTDERPNTLAVVSLDGHKSLAENVIELDNVPQASSLRGRLFLFY
jgi:hypothetical protein